jgi:Fe-S oxidoreductase
MPLFTGSEGTLGLIVEAEVKTVALPNRGAASALFFESFSQAIDAVSVMLPLKPVLCELVDRRILNMVRDWDARYHKLIPSEAEAVLLVELNAGTVDDPVSGEDCRNKLEELIDLVQTKKQLSFQSLRVTAADDFQLFDEVIRRSEFALNRMKRSIQPIPLFDDVAVPIPALPRVLDDLHSIFQRHKITASLSGHIGHGHLRIQPLFDFSQPDILVTLHPLAEAVYSMIVRHRGTISSEWGTGLLKTQFLPPQFPHLMHVFREIKETFDPLYQLNPGKVIPTATHRLESFRRGLEKRGQDPPKPQGASGSRLSFIKQQQGEESPSQLEIQLKWDPSHVFDSAYRCNGCGECFRFDRQSRVCPLFRGTARQEFAPRAKSDLLRGILEHDIDLSVLTGAKAKEIADSCFQCRMCDIECPSGVDVNVLAFRCKSAYTAAHGLSLHDLLVSRIDTVLNWLAPMGLLFNAAMRNRIVRWICEKTLQIPQGRTIPPLARHSYLNRIRWSQFLRRTPPEQGSKEKNKEKTALFVDTFVNSFDPQLAELAVQILEHNGFSVYVPFHQRPSGLFAFSAGHADYAERLARFNVSQMAELTRQGYRIVMVEPASASCITKDYRHLMDDDDANLTAANVFDFCTFLWGQHQSSPIRTDFQRVPYRIGYHAPCRGLAGSVSRTNVSMPAEELLRLIPELDVQRIERGCCGMAGFWGYKRQNYRHSLQIGTPLFRALRQPEIDFGVSDCNACCLQMAHGSKKRALHPIRILAAAYGFLPMPELNTR